MHQEPSDTKDSGDKGERLNVTQDLPERATVKTLPAAAAALQVTCRSAVHLLLDSYFRPTKSLLALACLSNAHGTCAGASRGSEGGSLHA